MQNLKILKILNNVAVKLSLILEDVIKKCWHWKFYFYAKSRFLSWFISMQYFKIMSIDRALDFSIWKGQWWEGKNMPMSFQFLSFFVLHTKWILDKISLILTGRLLFYKGNNLCTRFDKNSVYTIYLNSRFIWHAH